MNPGTGQSLRTDSCLANPSGMQAARWPLLQAAASVAGMRRYVTKS